MIDGEDGHERVQNFLLLREGKAQMEIFLGQDQQCLAKARQAGLGYYDVGTQEAAGGYCREEGERAGKCHCTNNNQSGVEGLKQRWSAYLKTAVHHT